VIAVGLAELLLGFMRNALGSKSTLGKRIESLLTARRLLLAQIHLNRIAVESTKADIQDRLDDLTTDLPHEYDLNIERIKEHPARAKLAFRAFSWLLAAKRPIHPNELCEALGIGLQDKYFRKDRMPSITMVLEYCLGLLRFNEALNTVEFFHFSVQEHLLSRNNPEEIAAVDVLLSYLTYLRFDEFSSICSDDQSREQRREHSPFTSYLSQYWQLHIQEGPATSFQD
jgi:hypothetical protein